MSCVLRSAQQFQPVGIGQIAYFIKHSTAVHVALMRTHLRDVSFEQLARCEEQLSDRAFGVWSLSAFDSRDEADHERCNVLSWRTEHHDIHALIGVDNWYMKSTLTADVWLVEPYRGFDEDFGVC